MAKKKKTDEVGKLEANWTRIDLLRWIIRQAQSKGGTVTLDNDVLHVTVPTVKAGGYGAESLDVVLMPNESVELTGRF
jgi:hypothetical protein